MSTVIFKWNVKLSGYPTEEYYEDSSSLKYGCYREISWRVWDHEKVSPADKCFWLCVGADQPCGIVAQGKIISKPYFEKDWRGSGRHTYFVNFMPDAMLPVDDELMLLSDVLEKEIPEFDWRGGLSGLVLTQEQAQKLDELWRKHVLAIFDMLYEETDMYLSLLTQEEVYLDERMRVEISQVFPCLELVQQMTEDGIKLTIGITNPREARKKLGLDSEQELYDYVKSRYGRPDGIDGLRNELFQKNIPYYFYCE